jgi:uncharacterized protein YacL (UPF0231 family)
MMPNIKALRGKRVLITIPELKKTAVELSAKDEDARMMEAMKQWQKLEVYAIGDEITGIMEGDHVYVQTYALESGEKIEVDGKMRILVPDTAIAIVW